MPFVQRRVSPVLVSRAALPAGVDDEREAVVNNTLAGTLRQMASVMLHAGDICDQLLEEFNRLSSRSKRLLTRVSRLQEAALLLDAKSVLVPESDLSSFSRRGDSTVVQYVQDTALFTVESRPALVSRLYEQAVLNPVTVLRQLDVFRRDGQRSSRFFTCTPTLDSQLARLPLEIETRLPVEVDALPDWSPDADLTSPVHPDSRFIPHRCGSDEQTSASCRLPRPEQLTEARSKQFPAQLVPVDTTGSGFQRLIKFRQSLIHFDYVKHRRKRRARQRRNTISDTTDVLTSLQSTSHTSDSVDVSSADHRFADSALPQLVCSSPSEQAVGGELQRAATCSTFDTAVCPAGGSDSGQGSTSISSEQDQVSGTAAHVQHTSDIQQDPPVGAAVKPVAAAVVSDACSLYSDYTISAELGGASDDDASSAFSCDAEGYYTSFHCDSGVRGAARAAAVDADALTSTSNTSGSGSTVVLRRRGRPAPPPRRSSLNAADRLSVLTVIHVPTADNPDTADDTDTIHPVSPGLRDKTAMTSGRIPSLCAVSVSEEDSLDSEDSCRLQQLAASRDGGATVHVQPPPPPSPPPPPPADSAAFDRQWQVSTLLVGSSQTTPRPAPAPPRANATASLDRRLTGQWDSRHVERWNTTAGGDVNGNELMPTGRPATDSDSEFVHDSTDAPVEINTRWHRQDSSSNVESNGGFSTQVDKVSSTGDYDETSVTPTQGQFAAAESNAVLNHSSTANPPPHSSLELTADLTSKLRSLSLELVARPPDTLDGSICSAVDKSQTAAVGSKTSNNVTHSSSATGISQSPCSTPVSSKQKHRSPFRINRSSIRLPRFRSTSSSSPTNQSASENEEEPRTDEQKLKRLKMKWFWSLPASNSKKSEKKSAGDEDSDDGGFGSREPVSSVVYESTAGSGSSSDGSGASTPLTDVSLSSSFYEMEQYFPSLNTSHGSGAGSLNCSDEVTGARTAPHFSVEAPRAPNFSSAFTEYSPPEHLVLSEGRRSVPELGAGTLSETRGRRSWSVGAADQGAGRRASWSGQVTVPPPVRSSAQLTRPTPLKQFKELVARQSTSPVSAARLSAADRLRTGLCSPVAGERPLQDRNSARAVLFQNRFGSRRTRTPRTNVIATTIPESEEERAADDPVRRQLFTATHLASISCSSPPAATGQYQTRLLSFQSPGRSSPAYSRVASGQLSPLAGSLYGGGPMASPISPARTVGGRPTFITAGPLFSSTPRRNGLGGARGPLASIQQPDSADRLPKLYLPPVCSSPRALTDVGYHSSLASIPERAVDDRLQNQRHRDDIAMVTSSPAVSPSRLETML